MFVGSNLKMYMPPTKDIWQRYLRKFSKNVASLSRKPLGLWRLTRQLPLLLPLLMLEPRFGADLVGVYPGRWRWESSRGSPVNALHCAGRTNRSSSPQSCTMKPNDPPAPPERPFSTSVTMNHDSVFIAGRYNKYSRDGRISS